MFIGNSFTQGAHSAARNWRAGSVTDLNRAGYGGVPAMFKLFCEQAGLDYDVSLETQGGKSLGFHYDERRQLFDRPWDVVVLQEFSTLDRKRPGDPADYLANVGRLAALFRARNPAVDIRLVAAWTRADQTWLPKGHWYGKPVSAMALDLRAAADSARRAHPGITGILPVGEAWNRAFAESVADPNPYDGIAFDQLDLWAYDHYHASVAELLPVGARDFRRDHRRRSGQPWPGRKGCGRIGVVRCAGGRLAENRSVRTGPDGAIETGPAQEMSKLDASPAKAMRRLTA
ncbi:PEP-CTERM sorting domain-containing protein [Sphingopyxis sp. PET50]|uniref:PEP-CTERM sorting domain-containing protein n=1 Tax=Sphingopyxis sp. PET50 TaxID=2976533 RepID=UPI0028AF4A1B|nr:PEP-CTERM sorting domain-containing protein [Sphingopyxis sp. PET50]